VRETNVYGSGHNWMTAAGRWISTATSGLGPLLPFAERARPG